MAQQSIAASLKQAFGYATFKNENVKAAALNLIENIDTDLIECKYEPSNDADNANEELIRVLNEADESDEEIEEEEEDDDEQTG